ncbi:MAG: glycerate kinase [Thaumarchaeota archaeon]|nr:glycerate kinase [Nitrososphaerota archaeon]
MASKSLIKNIDDLIQRRRGKAASLRRVALKAVESGIKSVMPENFMKKLKLRGRMLIIDKHRIDLKQFDEVLVLGAGKAAVNMAKYVERLLSKYISRGFIVVPKGLHEGHGLKKIKAAPSTHPFPSDLGLKAAQEMLRYAEEVTEKTLTIFLLSGGASALLPLPAPPLILQDKIEVTKLLLESGATIHEVNAVRKHLSAIKGGWLGKRLARGRVLSLILSDVVGDDIETIGSGPTAPDPTTFRDVYDILRRYSIWEKAPESVRQRITMGLEGKIEETPKPGDPAFKKITNLVIAGIRDACAAAASYLKSRGFKCSILTRFMEGEASQIGIFLAGILRELSEKKGKYAVICGGETTVTVRGSGLGGRNQELALSASIKMRGLRNCCLISVGTDGIDGVSEAAGAIVDPETYQDALRMGLNPIEFLKNNDSNTFFDKVGGAIYTGPTGTNVGDLTILLKC